MATNALQGSSLHARSQGGFFFERWDTSISTTPNRLLLQQVLTRRLGRLKTETNQEELCSLGRRSTKLSDSIVSANLQISKGATFFACRAAGKAAGASSAPDSLPSEDERTFSDLSRKGNLIPMYKRVFSDQLTPVLAYRCLVKEDKRDSPSFLFETIEQGKTSDHEGRFSSLGARPVMEILAKENKVTIINHEKLSREEKEVNDPMSTAEDLSSNWNPVSVDGLPDTFCGGWVGYFSYDTMRYVEKRKLPFVNAPEDDRDLLDIHLALYKDVIIFDHVCKIVYAVHWVQLDSSKTATQAFEDGKLQLDQLVSKIQTKRPKLQVATMNLGVGHYWEPQKASNMREAEYKAKIMDAKEHILAGDVFQVVLSQRFERSTLADPFDVYRALRVINPSPYMIYLQTQGSVLVGASPEILARIQKGKVINRPLAGTRRRGKSPQEDQELEKELLENEKEVAEHVMLVDLGRNDVGKVSKPGSVKVERLMDIERFSHVMHLSSTVTGELKDDMRPWDALRAALPVGTVSGAPKVRAMQLIDELEPTRRGPYSGGIGHISFTGEMDIALALRTMVFPTNVHSGTINCKNSANIGRLVHLQAGAGIVADSDPSAEHQECIHKASAMSRAIDLAEANFVDGIDSGI